MVFVHLYLVQLNFVRPIINKNIETRNKRNQTMFCRYLLELEWIDVNLNVVKDLTYWREEHHFYFHNNNEKHWSFYYPLLLMSEDQHPLIIGLKFIIKEKIFKINLEIIYLLMCYLLEYYKLKEFVHLNSLEKSC